MRVISKDGCINVPYESNTFCVIIDEESKIYTVAVRNYNLTGFMELATYDTLEDAKTAFNKMIEAGSNPDVTVFYFN